MQMFTVPQFIDVEDKIIGPMTVRQFIICLVGLGILVPAWRFLNLGYFIMIALFDFAITFTFAFIKINGRPFHYFVLNFIQTSKKAPLRVWNHKNFLKDMLSEEEAADAKVQVVAKKVPPKMRSSTSHLKELALIVDTKGVYKGGGEEEEIV
jgi:hypothetical protein